MAVFSCKKEMLMNKTLFENLPDVLNAKQLAEVLHLSKAGSYNLLNADDFPTLKIGGRKPVMKQDLLFRLKKHTNVQEPNKITEKRHSCKTEGEKAFEVEMGRLFFRLTAPYSEERRQAASEYAKQNGIASER